jgi:hypothetical protein
VSGWESNCTSERAVDRGGGPQLRQRYGVVAAEDYRGHAGAVDGLQALLYAPVAFFDVTGDDGDVAVVVTERWSKIATSRLGL